MRKAPQSLIMLALVCIALFAIAYGQEYPIPGQQTTGQATLSSIPPLTLGQVMGIGDPVNVVQFQGSPVHWGQWGQWSGCFGTCGVGNRRRQRRCYATFATVGTQVLTFEAGGTVTAQATQETLESLGITTQGIVSSCVGYLIEAQGCQLQPCGGRWGNWGVWGPCSVTCGGGSQSRSRSCLGTGGQCLVGGATMNRACNIQPCPAIAIWGQWTTYSVCSAACGGGTQTRTRVCLGSRTCPGVGSQTLRCNIQACQGTWGAWTAYSACTLPCGGGTQTRTRTCQGAQNCPGSGTNILRCNTQACVTYSWGAWGAFGACSATCGQGTYVRTRLCFFGTEASPTSTQCGLQGGSASETQTCFGPACLAYGDWGDWSACSATCGTGIETRRRVCFQNGIPAADLVCVTLPGQSAETRACRSGPCYTFSAWTEWTTCTTTCGPGTITRTRTCLADGQLYLYRPGELSCGAVVGELAQTQPCSVQPCYGFRPWAQWSVCSTTCGTGSRQRNRVCVADGSTISAPTLCRNIDSGLVLITEACTLGPCYGWATWGSWSACSRTCGGGQASRNRVCLSNGEQVPVNDGCIQQGGPFQELQNCFVQSCYSFGTWTDWTPCSPTCGRGERRRNRVCFADNFPTSAVNCAGIDGGEPEQVLVCNGPPCYSLTIWTDWTTCSATCGSGVISRTRRCVTSGNVDATDASSCTYPLNLGLVQTQACTLGPCFQWSPWSQGDQCSATCGAGVISRRRRCVTTDGVDSTTLTACADPQNLGAVLTIPCNNGPCYSFGQWTDWTVCSPVCGRGQRTRSRVCFAGNVPTSPLNCANIDGGQAEQVLECQGPPCYFYGEWADWTPCPVSCGEGTISRSRICRSRLPGPVPPGSCNTIDAIGALQTQTCRPGPCYTFGQWADWTACSPVCGRGQRTRSRVCFADNVPTSPVNCGNVDGGQTEQVLECQGPPCYFYDQWADWTSCPVSCGEGTISRTRVCRSRLPGPVPPGSCNTIDAIGAIQTQSCRLGPCYGLTDWTDWTTCSATCGAGQIRRSRSCVVIGTGEPGTAIQCGVGFDDLFQSEACTLGPCYNWSPWSQGDQCSATCGAGVISRRRRCVTADGVDAGSFVSCDDPLNLGAVLTIPCNVGPCYSFGRWTDWTACSPICGRGQRTRSRVCFADNVPTSAVNCANIDGGQSEQVLECQGPPCYYYDAWEDWTPCPVSCGEGTISRSRACRSRLPGPVPPGACNGIDDIGAIQTQTCNPGPCYSFGRWTDWTVCSPICGRGQRTRSRVCFAGNVPTSPGNCANIDGGQSEQVLECQGPPCYYYDVWADWTPCPVSCGQGTISRSRVCRSRLPGPVPPGACNGIDDIGAIQTQTCRPGPCYEFTRWTEWTQCSETCGDGFSTRTRRCVEEGTLVDAPSSTFCADPLNIGMFQRRACNLQPCYRFTPWSDWTRCSVTCGSGRSTRNRRCVSDDGSNAMMSNCFDPENLGGFQSRVCDFGPCYFLSQWTEWTRCSSTCGAGITTRTRRCTVSSGADAPIFSSCGENIQAGETQTCSLGPCFSWSPWAQGGDSCSTTCGPGTYARRRTCRGDDGSVDQTTRACDDSIQGAFLIEPCNLGPCYFLTAWTEWTVCSATCGAGIITRTRRCTVASGSDAPIFASCGENIQAGETQTCSLGPCYGYTPWTEWTDCSVTCGEGRITRSRTCRADDGTISPVLSNCADPFSVGAFQTQNCQRGPCYILSEWGEWSRCSATCGEGIIFRSKTCLTARGDNVAMSFCASYTGERSQQQACSQGPCYQFTQWGSWSRCSAQCGAGRMQRVRTCQTVGGTSVQNARCSTDQSDFVIDATCQKAPCPGAYREWGQWSQCSVSCNSGTRIRSRICSAERCIGRNREVQVCNDFQCERVPVVASWSAWSSWSACTNPCGGVSVQTRRCRGGTPSDCGGEEFRRTITCTDCPRGFPGATGFTATSCTIPGPLRTDCGSPGISQEECVLNSNCCWDNTIGNVPWCFNRRETVIQEGGTSSSGSLLVITSGGQSNFTLTETDTHGNTRVTTGSTDDRA